MPKQPFVVSPQLTAVAIAYQNQKLIADSILPPTPVPSSEFKWTLYPPEEAFTVPDTRVSRRGSVNQISFTALEQTSSVEPYGLEDPIPYSDILKAEDGRRAGINNYNPQAHSVEYLSKLLDLDREIRVAGAVNNIAAYATNRRVTLAGTSQYSDYANSNPLSDLLNRLDVPLVRPNVLWMGQDGWRIIRQHPRIVEAVKMTGAGLGAQGTIVRQALAELLEIEEVLVGEGWVNTAKRGLPATMNRVWGKNIGMIYRDKLAGPQTGLTFGFTAMWKGKFAGTIEDPNIGLEGGVINRVGMNCKEVICAPDAAYFIQNAFA
jgi:hypothetical protein